MLSGSFLPLPSPPPPSSTATISPGATAGKFCQYARLEAARAWELHQQGLIRELYFRADRNEAVLALECDSLVAAQQALDTLPLVEHGLIAFELIPLRAYPGFARLFAPEKSR